VGTVPSPYVPVAGDDATQARVLTWADAANYLLGNASSGGSKKAVAKFRQTVSQSLATSGTAAAVLFDTEDGDYDNGHSTVTNTSRYTAQTAGWNIINYTVGFASNAVGYRQGFIQLNGAANFAFYDIVPAVNGQITAVGNGGLMFLNAGDYIEVMALQTSTAALNITSGAVQCSLTVCWLSV
jgi:hypothetical protein